MNLEMKKHNSKLLNRLILVSIQLKLLTLDRGLLNKQLLHIVKFFAVDGLDTFLFRFL